MPTEPAQKKNLGKSIPNALFFAHLHVLLGQPKVASRTFGCGARKGSECTPRRRCGSPPDSVARILGVQRRAIWQVITGSLSASPSLTGQWQSHIKDCFPLLRLYHVCIAPSIKLSISLCGSHGTTVAHQTLPFVTITDGAYVCAFFRHVS